jgi:hypothetical protein
VGLELAREQNERLVCQLRERELVALGQWMVVR